MSTSVTYYGLDLGEYYSQLSYYKDGMAEPISISTIVGSEKYLIPTVVGKKEGYMQWYIGDEATTKPFKVEGLLSKAMKRERITIEGNLISAMDLLEIFIRRVLQLSGTVLPHTEEDRYVICIDHASHLAVETLIEVCSHLGIAKERVKICSRQECFCYYVMNQDGALRIHDVLLLDYWKHTFKVFQLTQDRSVEPTVVSVKEMQIDTMNHIPENSMRMTEEEVAHYKEQCLYEALDEILSQGIISSMYLVGDGFDGEWMKRSLQRMCAGRRVFGGKNLYTKGACYYGKASATKRSDHPEYLYLGGGNVLANVCLKAIDKNKYVYKVLVPAGYNWQDSYGETELLLRDDGGKKEENETVRLEFLIRSLRGEEHKESLELTGLELNGDMPLRLHVSGKAISTSKVKITVQDLGFGAMRPKSDKKWETELRLTI